MLQRFKSTLVGKSRNVLFRHYATKWACDMQPEHPASRDDDFDDLWDLLDEMPTFCASFENPKAMRWFSINGTFESQVVEL